MHNTRPCYSAAVPISTPNNKLLRGFRSVLAVVVFVGVAVALWRLAGRWDGRSVQIHWLPVVVSIGVLTLANYFQALAWKYLLEQMAGKVVPFRQVFSVFMAGQLARYTPGKVALPMVRIAGAPKLGLSARLIAASVGIEVGTWLGVGALVGFGTLLINLGPFENIPGISRTLLLAGLGATLLGFAVALGVDRNRFPAWLQKLLRTEGQGPFVSWRVVAMQLISWVGWWLLGILAPLSVGAPLADAVQMSPVFIVAPILGFLAIVAPGGLGVRETVISYALAPHIGASAALAAAVLARATAILSEIIGWVLGIVWERRQLRLEGATRPR